MRIIGFDERVTVHAECTEREMVAVSRAIVQLLTHERAPELPPPQYERVFLVQPQQRALCRE